MELDKAVETFASKIHSYDRYKVEVAYSDFVEQYYDLLSEVEDYYKDASVQGVLDLLEDKICKMLRVETEHECRDQELCPDPHTSTDNVLTGHQALNRLEVLPNFKTFKDGGEMAIVELFRCFQRAHNTTVEVVDIWHSSGVCYSPSSFHLSSNIV